MKLLVIGGTRFVGRHIVDAALERGDEVTIFTRGRQPNHWGERVTTRIGDRDPDKSHGLATLGTGEWDSVIDTSGYVPRIVKASARLLADRVGRYLFVSSISVFTDASNPGQDETAPVGRLEDPDSEEIGKHYGPLKAACEDVVSEIFGSRAINVRPGLIVGPYDPTDRFGYWVARFVRPSLLGARAEAAVVPLPRERPVQFIDARDLALWMVELVTTGASGTFNASSPAGLWTFGALVDALRKAGGTASPRAAWAEEATLLEHKVAPWTGLPLWIPATFADMAGFLQIDCTKAQRAGLRTRSLAQIIDDIAAWLTQRDNAGAWADVMTADVEREILTAVGDNSDAKPMPRYGQLH